MKLYIIDQNLDVIGGVERVCNLLATELNKDYNVHVVSKTKNTINPFFNYGNIKINYLFDNTKKYKFKIIKKIIRFLTLHIKIKKMSNQFTKDDIVIFGRIYVALNFLPYIQNKENKPKIIVRDAIHFQYFNNKIKSKILKYFPNTVDTLIVSSDESANEYKSHLKSSNMKILKIYNPLGIKPIKKYKFENKKIISIGRMDDNQKGYENLINAMEIVNNNHPEWKLCIYGDGAYKEKYNTMISELHANKYIEINSSIKNVVKKFNNSSIFILSSRTEGYANILVEAMACGIPCITYNWLMGADEIIKNGENGIIVNLKDRYGYANGKNSKEDCTNLALAINKLIENKQTCDKFSDNSVKIVEERNIDKIIKQWIDIINNLI